MALELRYQPLAAKFTWILTAIHTAADLHVFQGRIGEKADWSRGLFVSYSGFSPDGLTAFGRSKKIICIDGFDLSEALTPELPLNVGLERKLRHAAETGQAFARVRDLFV
jgi:hypothetical protein